MTPTAPREVQAVCLAFLELVDELKLNAIEGLYLHGSLGFGEWFPHTSDVDFVAVSSERLDPGLLRVAHARLQSIFPTPSFDGSHLTWQDLAQSPAHCPDVPGTLGGVWDDEGRVDLNPVTWHALARHSVRFWGPALDEIPLHTDQAELRAYTRENLATYWADLVGSLADFPAEAGKPGMVTWVVLGTSRLHHLLATDELTSKVGAGLHALAAFGERWQPLVSEALSWRESALPSGEYAGREDQRAADVIEFGRLVVDTGLALPR